MDKRISERVNGRPGVGHGQSPWPWRTSGVARWAGRRDTGQSVVEFALVVPVFLLLLAGMIDFGLGLYSDITVTNAAREGARLGVAMPYSAAAPSAYTSAIDARVRDMATSLDGTNLTVTTSCLRPSGSSWVACSGTPYQSGDAVVVKVDYTYKMLWPLAIGTVIPLSSTVQMRIE